MTPLDSIHPETALVPYLRDELSAPERARVEIHLAGCEQCRQTAESSAALLADLAREVEEIPQPDWRSYRTELHRKLAQREEAPHRWWVPARSWAPLATAGVALAALALIFMMRPGTVTVPAVDQLAMETAMNGTDVGLLRNYRVVERLDLFENLDVIENLDELPAPGHGKDQSPS